MLLLKKWKKSRMLDSDSARIACTSTAMSWNVYRTMSCMRSHVNRALRNFYFCWQNVWRAAKKPHLVGETNRLCQIVQS